MDTLNVIIQILVSFFVVAMIISVPLCGVLLVVVFNEKDSVKKKKLKTVTLWIFFGPILLLFVILSLWGFVRMATNTFAP